MNQLIDFKAFAIVLFFISNSLSAQLLNKQNPLNDFGCTLKKEHVAAQTLLDFNSVFDARSELQPYRKPSKVANSSFTHPVVALAKQYLGKPYRSGGKGPKGFDCSGFTSFVFRQFGVELPPSSHEQAAKAIEKVSKSDATIGNLAFFGYKTPKGKVIINHAAIIISLPNQPMRIIHSANHKGICITDVDKSKYWKQSFLFAGRIKQDLVAHSEIAALLLSDWQNNAPVM
jgi:cell wall-associated NlpC family hydrolase